MLFKSSENKEAIVKLNKRGNTEGLQRELVQSAIPSRYIEVEAVEAGSFHTQQPPGSLGYMRP